MEIKYTTEIQIKYVSSISNTLDVNGSNYITLVNYKLE